MNVWQTGLLTLGAAAIGWFACDQVKAGQMRADRVALETTLQDRLREYAAATVDAQRKEAERVIAAVQEAAALRAETAGEVQTIIREVQGAQVTAACVDSPAVRVALDGLRRLAEAPAARDPDAAPAGGIVPMLGGAGSSGR